MRNQFGDFWGHLPGLVLFFLPHSARDICSAGMCKVENNKLILFLQILKEFVCDDDSPWQKQKISHNRRTWVPQEAWKTSQKV